MSDADQAHMARYLKGIEQHAKVIANVLVALNENFVAMVNKLAELDNIDKENENMTQPQDNDAVEIHDLVEDINTLQAETGRQTTVAQDD